MKSDQTNQPVIITAETITEETMKAHKKCTALHAPNAHTIKHRAFMWNHDLQSASFPKALRIGESAFDYISGLPLEHIDIPKVKFIDSFAFANSGLREIEAKSVLSIAHSAFAHCHDLKYASLPQATLIDETGFYDCPQLASINIPKVGIIGTSAFAESAVTKVEAPSATEILKLAFQACKKLHTFVAPKARYINNSAFAYCPELKQVYLPNTKDIETDVFKTSTQSDFIQELEILANALSINNDQAIDSKQVSENAIQDDNTSNLEKLLVHHDLITAHHPETDRAWWLSRGIDPEKTSIDSLDAWAERQNITLSDTDALFILYRLNQDADYRPTWPELGRACPNLPFHLLLKVLPEDKYAQTLPLLSAATLEVTKPQGGKAKNELLASYFQGINMRTSADVDSQASSEKVSHTLAHQAESHEKEAATHTSPIEISKGIESIAETLTIHDVAKLMLAKANEPRLSKDTSLFTPDTGKYEHDTDTPNDAQKSSRSGPAAAA